ncbi:MAG: ATP-binding protein [Epsilonproteobacteria bacterium]|nr:ATP-binding protein [Campylobacterota bacterium]
MIGRKKEIATLNNLCDSDESSLVAIYGRRRIGKTYLVNYMFKEYRKECLFFEFTGTSNVRTEAQIDNFIEQVYEWFRAEPTKPINNWSDAFRFLKRTIDAEVEQKEHKEKVIIFIDEIPWIDPSTKANFLSALGYFWNTYCETRANIVMILCGSNASWIKNRIFEDAVGPLHNRLTKKIPMYPFDLKETKKYLLEEKGFNLDVKMVTDIYMIFGGVAKYLSYLDPKKSLYENIDELFFNLHGLMHNEYEKVFKSLFMNRADFHKSIIELLCSKKSGFTINEIAKKLELSMGKRLITTIDELVLCGFIKGVGKFNQKSREIKYIISDQYILFHHRWIKELSKNDVASFSIGYWRNQTTKQAYSIWSGFAFEIVVMTNIELYLKARGLQRLFGGVYHWQHIAKNEDEKGTQIDMVVDYGNELFDIVECKYHSDEFIITKEYAQTLKNKLKMFRAYGLNGRRKAELRLVFLTTYGVKHNVAFHGLNIDKMSLEELIGE